MVSSLKDDDAELDRLHYGDKVEFAVNEMQRRGHSRMPLFFQKGDKTMLIGTVSVQDLLLAEEGTTELVDLAQTTLPEIPTDDKLFDHIQTILEHGAAYGKDPSGEIVQIYTASDVANRLNTLAQMFLRVNEIEDLARQFLTGIDEQEVEAARNAHKSLKDIPLDLGGNKHLSQNDIATNETKGHPAESYMFSDYMKCIGNPGLWERHVQSTPFGEHLDKENCIRSFNGARIARNAVAHRADQETLSKLVPQLESLAVWMRKLVAESASENDGGEKDPSGPDSDS